MTLSGAGDVALLLDGRRLLNDAIERHAMHKVPKPVTENTTQGESHRGPSILVVDDSLTARRKLVKSLQRFPFSITEAADGQEAVEVLKTQQFDAIFSDLEMPRLNGFELLSEVAGNGSAGTPCVIVTTRNEPEIQARAKSLGAAGFMAKPVDEQAVHNMLNDLQLVTSSTTKGEE